MSTTPPRDACGSRERRVVLTSAQYQLMLAALARYEVTLEDEEPPHVAAQQVRALNRAWDALRVGLVVKR